MFPRVTCIAPPRCGNNHSEANLNATISVVMRIERKSRALHHAYRAITHASGLMCNELNHLSQTHLYQHLSNNHPGVAPQYASKLNSGRVMEEHPYLIRDLKREAED